MEEIAGGDAGFDLERGLRVAVFEDFDEGDEKVVHAVAQLLDVGVLIGGALVAVNGDALVHDVTLEVVFFADGFHHKLLEVTRKEEEAVFVREDDHVLGPATVGGVMPHEGEESGRVLADGRVAGDDVHRGGALEHRLDVEALKRGGEQTDGGEFRRAAADPIPHRKTGEPVLGNCGLVEFRTGAGDGDKVLGEIESGGLEGGGGFELAVAGLGGAAGFGDDDDEGFGELAAKAGENVVDAVGIGVVEEGHGELVLAGLAQRVLDQLRSEGRAADADHEQVFEFTLWAGDGAGVDFGGEVLDRGERGRNLGGEGGRRGELGRTQPVMTDHTVLVGIGDGPGF